MDSTDGKTIDENAPHYMCSGCQTTAGRMGCPIHANPMKLDSTEEKKGNRNIKTMFEQVEQEKKEWGNDLWKWVQKIHAGNRATYPMMTIFIRKLLASQKELIVKKAREEKRLVIQARTEEKYRWEKRMKRFVGHFRTPWMNSEFEREVNI